MHVFEWWEQVGVTGGNPHRQGEQASHRNQTHSDEALIYFTNINQPIFILSLLKRMRLQ